VEGLEGRGQELRGGRGGEGGRDWGWGIGITGSSAGCRVQDIECGMWGAGFRT
jgi:hypothetical protein